MKLNRGIRIALWVVPFVLFYVYILHKGFEYPVVDDIMINQTILSHENMLLPYVGIVVDFTRGFTKDFSRLEYLLYFSSIIILWKYQYFY